MAILFRLTEEMNDEIRQRSYEIWYERTYPKPEPENKRKSRRNSYSIKELREARKAKLQINPECEMCGSVDALHIHHINGYKYGHSLDNLQTLCVPCHSIVHGRQIPPRFVC